MKKERIILGETQFHGSIPYADLRSLGIPVSSIIDFSATVNPFPLPDPIRELFTSDGIAAYPDTECFEARRAIAAFHDIPLEWILVSAGLTEILFALPELFYKAFYLSPSYGDYTAAYSRKHKNIAAIIFPDSDEHWVKTIDKLRSEPFQLLIICNPNNPTGHYVLPERIDELCCIFKHATICIDESYQEMNDNCKSALSLIPRFRNLLILKSLTKPFGIGGIRAGYAVSSGDLLIGILIL